MSKATPNNVGQLARSAANKLRNIAKAKARRDAKAFRLSNRWIAGKPIRGTARTAKRDAARPAWQAQEGELSKLRPLSAFCV